MNHSSVNIDHQKTKQIWLVSYINRSGSTFLLNELNKYNQIVSLPEGERLVKFLLSNPNKKTKYINLLVSQINQMIETDQKLKLFGITIDETDIVNCQNYADVFFRFLIKSANYLKPEAKVLVFKDTRLIKYFDRRVQLETKHNLNFIFLTRDPRAIYCSQKKTIGSWGKPMTSNPIITAKDWNHFEMQKLALKLLFHNNLHEISYENLIKNLNAEIGKLLQAFDIPNENLTRDYKSDYINLIPDQLKSIHENINKQPLPEKIESWKLELGLNEIFAIQKTSKKYMGIENCKDTDSVVAWHKLIIVYVKWYLGYWVEKIKRLLFQNRDLSPLK